MITLSSPQPNLSAPTDVLLGLKKDLEAQLMHHQAAEGKAYWDEKPILANVKEFLRLVNQELAKRSESSSDL